MILDIINKKRLGKELNYRELDYFFNGYLDGDVADYQMSALLMAICINGMSDEEIKNNNEYANKLLDVSNDIIVFNLLKKEVCGGKNNEKNSSNL